MLQEPMMEKLSAMRLLGMVDALKVQEQDPQTGSLGAAGKSACATSAGSTIVKTYARRVTRLCGSSQAAEPIQFSQRRQNMTGRAPAMTAIFG